MSIKRTLFLTHRYFGIGFCLLFTAWFISGMVMMYVGFPELTEEERFKGLAPLDGAEIRIDLGTALATAGLEASPQQVRMTTVLGRPAFHILPWSGRWRTVFADTNEKLEGVSPEQAVAIAQDFMAESTPAYRSFINQDQWTVSNSLALFRPLHRVYLGDPQGTELYISHLTGEVVRDTYRTERAWNWIGAVIHWIYPFQLRQHPRLWRWLLIVLSTLGTLLTFTGIVVGLLRFRFRRPYRSRQRCPYRGIMRWHHLLGLSCALFVFTWIISGLLSMNPGGIFPSKTPPPEQRVAYEGGPFSPILFQLSLSEALRTLPSHFQPKELKWIQIGGQPYYVFYRGPEESLIVPGDIFPPQRRKTLPAATLSHAIHTFLPGQLISQVQLLKDYDHYYYAHHHSRRLPVLRIKFDDKAHSWYHIDPHDGQLIERLIAANRAQRWLYNGFHNLDLLFLIQHRPLWDGVVIGLSFGGLALSLTAILVAWKRLRRIRPFQQQNSFLRKRSNGSKRR